MFLGVTLAVAVVVSMIVAVVVDVAYHAVAERRWHQVLPLVAMGAALAVITFGVPFGSPVG